MKGKKIVGLVILIIIIAGLFLGIGFFIGKGKTEGNKADNDTKQEEKKEEKKEEYLKEINFETIDFDGDHYSFVLANGDKTYSFDYKKEKDNKAEELFVDNHKIFEGGYYSLMKVGVMDNGMIVLDLSDVAFQAGTVRDYWDSNYSLVKKVNDVPFGTDLLASKYNYTKDMGYCIDDSYHEVTIAELTIVGNEFQEKIVRKDKVYNCAGLTY